MLDKWVVRKVWPKQSGIPKQVQSDTTAVKCFVIPEIITRFLSPEFTVIFLLIYFQQDATLLYNFTLSGKLLYVFRMVTPPIISSTYNCIYSIWYLSNRYCYLPL